MGRFKKYERKNTAIAACVSRFDSGNIMFCIAYYFLDFFPRF